MANEQVTNTTILSRADFEKSPLKSVYLSYDKYLADALKYSAFDLAKSGKRINFDYKTAFIDMKIKAHEKHNAQSEKMIARYKELEQIYLQMKGEQASLNNSLQSKYGVSSNKELLSAMSDNNSLFDRGLYNKSAKSVDEAYANFISALQSANYQTHRIIG